MLAGAGIGLMLTPASTDTVNRAPSSGYSEVTGITQTARNFGASLGLAVLGALLIGRNDVNLTAALTKHGVPGAPRGRSRTPLCPGRRPAAAQQPAGADPRRSTRVRAFHADGLLHDGRRYGRGLPVAFLWLPRGRVEEAPAVEARALDGALGTIRSLARRLVPARRSPPALTVLTPTRADLSAAV